MYLKKGSRIKAGAFFMAGINMQSIASGSRLSETVMK